MTDLIRIEVGITYNPETLAWRATAYDGDVDLRGAGGNTGTLEDYLHEIVPAIANHARDQVGRCPTCGGTGRQTQLQSTWRCQSLHPQTGLRCELVAPHIGLRHRRTAHAGTAHPEYWDDES